LSDKEVLQKIKEDLIADGLRWSMASDQKLIHLWRKLQRTEEAYRTSHQEMNSLKKQQKQEMAELEEFISNIRNLSQEKEEFTHSLEEENKSLRTQLRQIHLERDAFIQENQSIVKLLLDEGLNQFAGSTPKQPVEHLLQERSERNSRILQLETENKRLVEELTTAAAKFEQERTRLEDSLQKASEQGFKAIKKEHEAEKATLVGERDRYKSESEENQQRLKLLQMEVKSLKSKLAAEGKNHEIEKKKLRDELEGIGLEWNLSMTAKYMSTTVRENIF